MARNQPFSWMFQRDTDAGQPFGWLHQQAEAQRKQREEEEKQRNRSFTERLKSAAGTVAGRVPGAIGTVARGEGVAKPVAGFLEGVRGTAADDLRPIATGLARTLPGGQADIRAAETGARQSHEGIMQTIQRLQDDSLTEEQKQHLGKLLASQMRDSGLSQQELASISEMPSVRQVLASAGQLGLLAAAGPLGRAAGVTRAAPTFSRGVAATERTGRLAGGTRHMAMGSMTRGQVGRAAGVMGSEGAGYGLLGELTREDPTREDLTRSGLIGAAGGGIIPIAGRAIGGAIRTRRAGRAGTAPDVLDARALDDLAPRQRAEAAAQLSPEEYATQFGVNRQTAQQELNQIQNFVETGGSTPRVAALQADAPSVSMPVSQRTINIPEDARQVMQANIEQVAEGLQQANLRPGRVGKFDTPLTAALTLENRTRREGMGPLGQMVINNLDRISRRSRLQQSLTESFLGAANVNRKFLRKNDEVLFKLGEQIGRRELISDSAAQLARRYNTSEEVINTLRAGRLHYDEMLELANNARQLRGEKLIKARENYVPHLRELTEGTQEQIFQATGKRPFFEKRRVGETVRHSYVEALENYQAALSFDVYMSPVVKEGNALVRGLRELAETAATPKQAKAFNKSADFHDKWLREAITKQDVPTLNVGGVELGVGRGTKTETVLQKINQVRAINSLVGGFRYLTSTLPASIVQTAQEAGVASTIKGAAKFIASPKIRREYKQLSKVGQAKRAQGIGITAGGQLDFSRGALMKGKTQKIQEVVSVPNEVLENLMTGISWQAGRESGRKLRLTGKRLNNYADYATGISQEIYNTEMRAEILRNLAVRSGFPFQTFVVGQANRMRRFTGRGGGIPLTHRERFYQATTLVVGTALYNALSDARGLGPTTTVGSFIPFAGAEVDKQLRDRFGADTLSGLTAKAGGFDRPQTALQGDIEALQRAYSDFIDRGDWTRLRRETLKWAMGLPGVGGAGQIARTMEGLELLIFGDKPPTGELPFSVERDPSNIFQAITGGRFATREGRAFLESIDESKRMQKEMTEQLGLEQITITKTNLSDRMKAEAGRNVNEARRMAVEHNEQVNGLIEQVRASNMTKQDKERHIERLKGLLASTQDYALRSRLGLN